MKATVALLPPCARRHRLHAIRSLHARAPGLFLEATADSEVRVAEVLEGVLAWAATGEDGRAVEAVASEEHGREAAALVVAAWAVAPVAVRAAPMAMARAAMEEGKATATAKAHAEVA